MAITPELQSALQLHQNGLTEEAEAAYQAILAKTPNDPHAMHFLGVIALQREEFERAAGWLERAVAGLPNEPVFLCNLGQALMRLDRGEEALSAYQRSLAIAPRLAQTWHNLALLHEARQDDLQALTCRLRARELRPGPVADPDLHRLLMRVGQRFFEEGAMDRAAESFKRAAELVQADGNAWSWLASSQTLAGRPLQAMAAFERAIALMPKAANLYNNRANAYRDAGLLAEADADYAEAIRLHPAYLEARSNFLFTSQGVGGRDAASLGRLHREYAAAFAVPALVTGRSGSKSGRPRLGIISGDLRRHPVAWFMLAWFLYRDRSAFDLTIYNVGTLADQLTERIRTSADTWLDCAELDDVALADRVAADGIDVLLDLSGHTADNRLGVFARRPARRQATYLGYAGTTGLECFDARIADWVTEPEGEEFCSSEPVLRMDGSYFCYCPPELDLPVGPPPSLKQRHVTFGCSAQLGKVGEETLALWAAVLKATPKSRLVLRSMALDDPLVRKRFLARAARAGVDTARVRLDGPRSLTDHLKSWNAIDITLDTTPFNLATQTCESLWMGVPVVTLRGARHASRMGASILSAAGLAELVAVDDADFVWRSVALAQDKERLRSLRSGMRDQLLANGGLMDGQHFARRLDGMLRQVADGPAGLRR